MEFADMIKGETDPIISGLKLSMSDTAKADAGALMNEFLSDQRAILTNLTNATDSEDVDVGDRTERREMLQQSIDALTQLAA